MYTEFQVGGEIDALIFVRFNRFDLCVMECVCVMAGTVYSGETE